MNDLDIDESILSDQLKERINGTPQFRELFPAWEEHQEPEPMTLWQLRRQRLKDWYAYIRMSVAYFIYYPEDDY